MAGNEQHTSFLSFARGEVENITAYMNLIQLLTSCTTEYRFTAVHNAIKNIVSGSSIKRNISLDGSFIHTYLTKGMTYTTIAEDIKNDYEGLRTLASVLLERSHNDKEAHECISQLLNCKV